jgi:plastocyanin
VDALNTTRLPLVVMIVGVLVGAAIALAPPGVASPPAASQNITVYIFPDSSRTVQGPDGRYHDVFIPSSFVLRAGEPVRLTVVNYDDMRHTITVPDLGLNIEIAAGTDIPTGVAPTTTVYSFTPSKKGTFRWYCALPCDDWAMASGLRGPGREGYMAGYITVY